MKQPAPKAAASAPASSDSLASFLDPSEKEGPTLPEQFDRYRILKKLGQGGMGAVYLAHDSKLNRQVALKVPKFAPGSNPENLERFYREARATATIRHPNLCPLYDVGEYNGIPFLTMAFIEGWPLSSFVRPDKRLPQAGTAAMVRTVALAVAEAHKLGIIHRDLKPGNILIDKRGQPIVMDFGLARWMGADKDDVRLTKSGSILGAPIYMSPEQVYGDVDNMGPGCDIYSLGVILYELLTGQLPFEGTTTAVLAKTLIQQPTPPTQHRPDLDPRLEAICLKAMAKQPGERFASMMEFASALAEYLKAEKLERDGSGSSVNLSLSGLSAFAPPSSETSRSPGGAPRSGHMERSPLPAPDREGDVASRSGDRPTPNHAGRETVTQTPDTRPTVKVPEEVKVRATTAKTRGLPLGQEPSASFVQRVSPKPPPLLNQVRRARKKVWLIATGILFCFLLGGGLLAWFLWPTHPSGAIRVRLAPAGAKVVVELDGRVLDPNLLKEPMALAPGNHRLVVSGKEFEHYTHTFTVQEGDLRTIEVELKPLMKKEIPPPLDPPPPPPDPSAPLEEPFTGHDRPVRCVALTADGKRAVSGGDDGKLILWNVTTHKPIFAVQAHSQPIRAIALSGDGRRAVTGGADKAVRVWDLSSGTTAVAGPKMENLPGVVFAVALSGDGQRIVSGGEDKIVRLWNANNGQPVKPFNGHGGAVLAVAFSANGQEIASGSEDQTVRCWNVNTGQEVRKLTGPTSAVRAIAYSGDGKRILAGGDDSTLVLWELDKPKEPRRFGGTRGRVNAVAFTADEQSIVAAASGPFENNVRLWDVKSGTMLRIVGRHKDGVSAVACSRTENRALSAGNDGVLRLWDLSQATTESALSSPEALVEVLRFRYQNEAEGAKSGLDRVVVARDGRRVITAGLDGIARIWDAATGTELLALRGHKGPIRFVDLSPDGNLALTCSADKTAAIWSTETGQLFKSFDGHKAAVLCGAFLPKGDLVVTAGTDGAPILWKTDTGQIVKRFEKKHGGDIIWLALSPGGKRLLTAGRDGNLGVWETETGKFIRTIHTGHPAAFTVAFLPDGKRAVTGGSDRIIRLWDVDKPAELRRFEGHTGAIYCVAVSPGGRRLLSSGPDRTVVLWDLDSGRLLTRYLGHTAQIGGVTFTPDGSQAFSASADHTLRLYDLPRGACDPPHLPNDKIGPQNFRTFNGHTDAVESVVFSPDGRRALSASWDKSLRVWDVAEGQQLVALFKHTDKVHAVAISPDGKRALTAGYDNRVWLWNLETFTPIRELKGHTGAVQSVGFSPNGKRAVSAGSDNSVRIWDVETGSELKVCTGHTGPIWVVEFLPDDKHILSAGFDKTIRRWDAASGREVARWNAPSELHALAVSPDGRRAISGGRDRAVHLWDVATGQLLTTFQGHTNTIPGVAFSPDGRFAMSGGDDNTARLWDVETGREVARLNTPGPVLGVAFSPNGRFGLLGGRDRGVRLWALPEFTAAARPGAAGIFDKGLPALDRLALSPDGRLALFAGMDGTGRLWDVAARKELRQLKGHQGALRFAAFAPDGQRACTSGEDGTVRVWSVKDGKELLKINAHPKTIAWSAIFSPDGRRLLSSGADGLAHLWDAADGKKLGTFGTHEKMVNMVAFTPDGQTLLTASHDPKFPVGVFETATGRRVRRLDGQPGASSVAVSPDGRLALTGGNDNTVRLWLLETGECLHIFTGHTGSVWFVAFSPNGRFALSGSADETVRLWDVRYGNAITTFTGHTKGVTAVAFFPDSRRAASVSQDQSFRLWNLPPR